MYQNIQKLLGAVALTALMLTSPVWADFYVIPVNKKIKNVVTVAKSGAQFTDVKTAMDSITDANETNRYLLYVGPGVYSITAPIQLKEWVTLEGAGEQATLLSGAISKTFNSDSAIILGKNNATLSDLSVKNTGGDDTSIGIYNYHSSPTLSNVTATASGGNVNSISIYNFYSSPTFFKVTATASEGTYSTGIYNNNSSPTLTNVTATASGGTTNNTGIYNGSSSPILSNVTVIASEGTYSTGIYNSDSSPTLTNVTAAASGGTSNYGIRNYSSFPKIYFSRMTGNSNDVLTVGGSPTCIYCVGNSDAKLNSTCQ